MNKEDLKIVNNLKILGIDMIDHAGSGHPGIVLGAAPIIYTLYAKHMKINPSNPKWINRDRFVLSAGHASALLYATLHMAGYDLSINDLKSFRELNSVTPGHPEYNVTPGVDVSTGPLGQGVANAVGMAMAERYIRNLIKKYDKNSNLIDYYTYCLCGDGDLMEGVAAEAASFAGNQNLDKLIILYDRNQISLDGKTNITFDEDVEERFESYGFNVIEVKNGENVKAISNAITEAKKSKMPSLIIVNTIIGRGSELENTNKVHGKPLEKTDISKLREILKITSEPFVVDEEAKMLFRNQITKRCNEEFKRWLVEYKRVSESNNSKLGSILNSLEKGILAIDFDSSNFKLDQRYKEELRLSNHRVMNIINEKSHFFLGGSADLSSSCKTNLETSGICSRENPVGKNIYFGVREHAMGAILNGMALSNLKVFGSTFLVFSDYLKPAMRMSALMDLPVTYIFTHDSIAVGQDGPTHEPVEQLSMLRTIPNMKTFRPADINEVMGSWEYILKNNHPASLVISKNEMPMLTGTNAKYVSYGAYMVRREIGELEAIIIATGTEVKTAIELAEDLTLMGHHIRVVSMPSMELFLKQDKKYEEILLPKHIKTIVIEPSNKLMWCRFATSEEYVLGIDDFGASGKSKDVLKKYGYDYESLKERCIELLKF
ncbi:MAG: transketolase [Bacilli bacterium]|nr:transketolase [Bacilli bacterium]